MLGRRPGSATWHRGSVPGPPTRDSRDRDPSGRARNARPRDAAGRPLPRGALGVERVPEDLVLAPDETVREAQRLLDAGMPFHAHEVLEAAWKAASAMERELWRGLAQLAVGLTHAMRGNTRGATTLLERGAGNIGGYAAAPPHGIDVEGLTRWAGRLAADPQPGSPPRLRRSGTPPATGGDSPA
jgi:hypothetical protein